jgi:hypothetical protein
MWLQSADVQWLLSSSLDQRDLLLRLMCKLGLFQAGKRLLSHPQLSQSMAIRLNAFGELSLSRYDIAPVRFGLDTAVGRCLLTVRIAP